MLKIDNLSVNVEVIDILNQLKLNITNGKLSNYKITSSGISVPCPFHSDGHEKHNSCYINEQGTYHCFTCNAASNSLLPFIAACLDCSPIRAKKWVEANFESYVIDNQGIQLGNDISIKKHHYSDTKELVLPENLLSWCPYLGTRKLTRTICEKFNVKYDQQNRQVIFPCYDIKNRLIMLARRSIDQKLFMLDKDVEKPLYCLNTVIAEQLKQCMIVEGPIDCLTCWCHGVPAIATLGSITSTQIKQLNRAGISTLYVAFDNDDAGKKFNATLKKYLSPHILAVDVNLPHNRKDVNDLTDSEWNNLIVNFNLPKIKK